MKKQNVLILLLVIAFLFLISFFIARSLNFYQNQGSDFFSLWLAPHLLIQGQDPYDAGLWVAAHYTYGAGWISDSTFLYPLPLAGTLIPIGILPLKHASVLWVFLSLAACILIVWRLINFTQPGTFLPYLLPAMAGVLLFRPTFLTILVGQIEILLMVCLVVTARMCEKGAWIRGGIIFSLVLLKPQIGVPLVALWCVWLTSQRRWYGLAGVGIGSTCLFLLGAIFDPAWLFRWISIGQDKVSGVFGYSPTIWGLSATVCQHQIPCTYLVGSIFSIFVLALGVWILLRKKNHDPIKVLGIIIPVTLLATPYLWAYTQVLLIIPILLIMGGMYHSKFPYLLTSMFPFLMAVLAFVLLFVAVAVVSDVWSALVPLSSLILLSMFL